MAGGTGAARVILVNMIRSQDLSPKWIFIKAGLFALILILSSVLILLEDQAAMRAPPLLLVIWSAARLYYFTFYVIERYVDPAYRFAGVWDCLVYLARKRARSG